MEEEKKEVLLLQAPPLEDISYNEFLYNKRLELGFSRRKFAKQLKIFRFRYKLIENGYIKPTKKDVKKISEYFDMDFNYYLEGIRSYPKKLDDEKYNPISNFMYHMFTKKWLRITFLVIAILSVLYTIFGFVISTTYDYQKTYLHDDKVVELKQAIMDKGNSNFSINTFSFPTVSQLYELENGNENAVIFDSSYNEKQLDFSFREIYWYDHYRFSITISDYNVSAYTLMVNAFNYDTYESDFYSVFVVDGELVILSETEMATVAKGIIEKMDINFDFTTLFHDKLGIDASFDSIMTSINNTRQKYSSVVNVISSVAFLTLFLSFVFVFLSFFAWIYQKKKDEIHSFSHSDELLELKCKNLDAKKDIKIFPFIPETFVRLVAFLFIFFGALRILMLSLNVASYSAESMEIARQLFSIQMLGMFLVFYINFDIFMKDNRIFRNIVLYPLIFLMIYLVEGYLLTNLTSEQSVISFALDKFTFPNPFATATFYFLMIFFLFLTPSFINTKKKLIIFRSMTIIPILLIIFSFIFGHSDVLFGFKFTSYWTKLLFIGDRITISILAISYLISLFFLRLHYKRKYGEEKAFRYFNGNRYIFTKNLIATGLIVIIWIFEMIFSGNQTLNSLGIGQNTSLIIIAPLVLLYHPHKNKRNAVSDIILISIYGLVLTTVYLSGVALALLGLFA